MAPVANPWNVWSRPRSRTRRRARTSRTLWLFTRTLPVWQCASTTAAFTWSTAIVFYKIGPWCSFVQYGFARTFPIGCEHTTNPKFVYCEGDINVEMACCCRSHRCNANFTQMLINAGLSACRPSIQVMITWDPCRHCVPAHPCAEETAHRLHINRSAAAGHCSGYGGLLPCAQEGTHSSSFGAPQ